MTEEGLKQKPKWDEASRILSCCIEDAACDGHSVGYVRLVEYEGQPDDEKEKLWLCQRHFSMVLKQEEQSAPEPAEKILPGCDLPIAMPDIDVQYLPLTWAPLEPGLNLSATSLEAEHAYGRWHLISRGEGSQWQSRTHFLEPPVERATPVRKGDDWFWQIVTLKEKPTRPIVMSFKTIGGAVKPFHREEGE